MIDGTFDRLAKWWRNAVVRFELQSQKIFLGPKNDFPKFGFFAVKFFCAKKFPNIQIVTHPYLGRLWKNVLEVFHNDIANLACGKKCIFLFWGPNIDWFPVGPFGLTFVKNDWWGVWPSCQMMKICCWQIWAPKSGKIIRPKKRFSKIWFLDREIFFGKKTYQYPNSNSPLFGRIVKKRIGSFSRQYCQFGLGQKVSI